MFYSGNDGSINSSGCHLTRAFHARRCRCFSCMYKVGTMSVANHAKHELVQALAPIITAVGLETQFAYPKKGNWTFSSAYRTISRK